MGVVADLVLDLPNPVPGVTPMRMLVKTGDHDFDGFRAAVEEDRILHVDVLQLRHTSTAAEREVLSRHPMMLRGRAVPAATLPVFRLREVAR